MTTATEAYADGEPDAPSAGMSPRRFDPAWLTSVIAAATSWIVSAVTPLIGGRGVGDEVLLLIGWGVTVALPITMLAVHLYPAQLMAAASHRAYRMGRVHAQEAASDRADPK